MANSRACPDDFVPGPLSSEDLNQRAFGAIAQRVRSSDSGGTVTIEAVLETDTLALPGGRRYRIEGQATLRTDTPGGVQLALHDNGSQIQRINDTVAFANKDICYTIIKEIEPSAGDHVYGLIVGNNGAGNSVQSRADGPAGVDGETCLYVTDVGPSYE